MRDTVKCGDLQPIVTAFVERQNYRIGEWNLVDGGGFIGRVRALGQSHQAQE